MYAIYAMLRNNAQQSATTLSPSQIKLSFREALRYKFARLLLFLKVRSNFDVDKGYDI